MLGSIECQNKCLPIFGDRVDKFCIGFNKFTVGFKCGFVLSNVV